MAGRGNSHNWHNWHNWQNWNNWGEKPWEKKTWWNKDDSNWEFSSNSNNNTDHSSNNWNCGSNNDHSSNKDQSSRNCNSNSNNGSNSNSNNSNNGSNNDHSSKNCGNNYSRSNFNNDSNRNKPVSHWNDWENDLTTKTRYSAHNLNLNSNSNSNSNGNVTKSEIITFAISGPDGLKSLSAANCPKELDIKCAAKPDHSGHYYRISEHQYARTINGSQLELQELQRKIDQIENRERDLSETILNIYGNNNEQAMWKIMYNNQCRIVLVDQYPQPKHSISFCRYSNNKKCSQDDNHCVLKFREWKIKYAISKATVQLRIFAIMIVFSFACLLLTFLCCCAGLLVCSPAPLFPWVFARLLFSFLFFFFFFLVFVCHFYTLHVLQNLFPRILVGFLLLSLFCQF